jgi:hypothetical protein
VFLFLEAHCALSIPTGTLLKLVCGHFDFRLEFPADKAQNLKYLKNGRKPAFSSGFEWE